MREVRREGSVILNLRQLKFLNRSERETPELLAEVVAMRPQTRSQCVDGPRPCIFVSCKHNLYLDVSEIGSVKLNFPDKDVDELEETCALDVAGRGGITLEVVGSLMALTRERVRQIEEHSSAKLRDELDDDLEPKSEIFQPKLVSAERRAQLREAKKKYRQGIGREKTNEAQARYRDRKKAT